MRGRQNAPAELRTSNEQTRRVGDLREQEPLVRTSPPEPTRCLSSTRASCLAFFWARLGFGGRFFLRPLPLCRPPDAFEHSALSGTFSI